MESLDDTFSPRVTLGRPRTRLVAGALLLVVAVPIAAIAFHRVALDLLAALVGQTAARQTTVALTGLFVPAAFAVAVLRLPAARPVKLVAVGGVVTAALAAALFLITVPTDAYRAGAIPPTVVLLYLAGAVVAVGAPLSTIAAALRTGGGSRRQAERPTRVTMSDSSGPPRTVHPTDGGRERDRLEFLLDDDP